MRRGGEGRKRRSWLAGDELSLLLRVGWFVGFLFFFLAWYSEFIGVELLFAFQGVMIGIDPYETISYYHNICALFHVQYSKYMRHIHIHIRIQCNAQANFSTFKLKIILYAKSNRKKRSLSRHMPFLKDILNNYTVLQNKKKILASLPFSHAPETPTLFLCVCC